MSGILIGNLSIVFGEQIYVRLIEDNYKGHIKQKNKIEILIVGLRKHHPFLMSRPLLTYVCLHRCCKEIFWTAPFSHSRDQQNAIAHFSCL